LPTDIDRTGSMDNTFPSHASVPSSAPRSISLIAPRQPRHRMLWVPMWRPPRSRGAVAILGRERWRQPRPALGRDSMWLLDAHGTAPQEAHPLQRWCHHERWWAMRPSGCCWVI
jgi:hypothetical protein